MDLGTIDKPAGHKLLNSSTNFEVQSSSTSQSTATMASPSAGGSRIQETVSATHDTEKALFQRPDNVRHDSVSSSLFSPHVASTIAGEVALTPTHSNATFTPQLTNPHSAMTAVTPMASGPHQAKNSIKLQNCVSTVSLGCELKLLDIYCRTRFSEYNPARFHGVVMKILEPRATALVFRSGKIVCTGARNEHDSYLAARKFARIIHKLGFPVKFLDFKIQNFIATADLRFPVRLEALQQAHGQFTSYEPELFPGLVYRMVRPRVVLLIFVNGKIVFTGGKNRNEICEALDIIYPILRSYRKN
ncbi:unnamed protein product [Plutella xylostella]|uniref:(diamondback moth) hypothetical protein n=1 Tax=Plutella xylostella TaxID=51655 RepID=A0A8S4G2F9_PLUXY|nr:unnamed protein product [Plutella xylostella]